MKCKCFIFISLFTLPVLCFMNIPPAYSAQQSNFQIAPSPIAYPYFEGGRFDGQADLSFISISMQNFSLMGGDIGGKSRSALSDFIALDGTLGMTFLGGTMKPGLIPVTYYSTTFYATPGNQATLSFIGMRGSINLELMPVHTSALDIIFFGGPQLSYSNYTITSDYNLVRIIGGQVYTGYQDRLTLLSTMGGFQAGIQMDLNLGNDLKISPFFMVTSSSGSATMTDDPQLSGYSAVSYRVDIPRTTSISFGMDIISGDISIGTILQQLSSSQQSEGTNIIMISVNYHFSSGGSETANAGEAQ